MESLGTLYYISVTVLVVQINNERLLAYNHTHKIPDLKRRKYVMYINYSDSL